MLRDIEIDYDDENEVVKVTYKNMSYYAVKKKGGFKPSDATGFVAHSDVYTTPITLKKIFNKFAKRFINRFKSRKKILKNKLERAKAAYNKANGIKTRVVHTSKGGPSIGFNKPSSRGWK